ncbi:Wadjet anti-phage system protein JetD domain-containing protein [Litchfieldella rifensis]|uniref:Wadjet anti-phage system protein JetD domain-containing protein n=1 Tax=Litchfieldella rifensis TaxID=762643 RepID=A0ABV7LVF4_9GAMM
MSYLSECAEAVQIYLEGDWAKHYRKRGAKRWRSVSLVKRLKREGICTTELDGWEALSELARAGVIETTQPIAANQCLNVHVSLSEAERHRLEAEFSDVDDALQLQAGQAVVWRHALDGVLYDWSLDDQYRLAQGLRELAGALPQAYAMSAFEASARYLLGSSKLLTALPRELVRAFAIDVAAFRGPVAWVLAAMPSEPEGLLVIENPQSFDQACRAGLSERLALVCSFGYGLSLSEVLKAPERVRLIGEGTASRTLSELLGSPNKTFWGDLDPEGLRIYCRLRQTVPALRLSALYGPMIAVLESGGGHPLHGLTGKADQRPARGWSRGLDQEMLDDASLTALAGQALDEAIQQRWLAYLGSTDVE